MANETRKSDEALLIEFVDHVAIRKKYYPGQTAVTILDAYQELRDMKDEILRRMSTGAPPKTEETTFGKLLFGESFLDMHDVRNVVSRQDPGFKPVALCVEGPSLGRMWFPIPGFPVRKLIK